MHARKLLINSELCQLVRNTIKNKALTLKIVVGFITDIDIDNVTKQ